MARRRHHRNPRRHRNPMGITSETIKEAAWVTAGALSAPYLGSMLQQTGWMNVAATAGAGIGISYAGKAVLGSSAGDELLKGALVSTIIQALKAAGLSGNLGLGMYVNTTFPLPTASDAYGRIPLAPMTGAPATAMTPTGAGAPGTYLAPSTMAQAKALSGYSRFRTRYGGRF
jgi:hypothetical protein